MRVTAARRKAQAQLIDLATASGLSAAHQHEHAQALLWFTHAVRLASSDPERHRLNRIRVRNWDRCVIQPDFRLALPGFRYMQDHFLAFEFHASGRFSGLDDDGRGFDLGPRPAGRTPHPRRSGEARRRCVQPRRPLARVRHARRTGRDPRLPDAEARGGLGHRRDERDRPRLQPRRPPASHPDRRGARVWDVERRTFPTPRLPHPAPWRRSASTVPVVGWSPLRATAGAGRLPSPTRRSSRSYAPVPHSLGNFGVSHGGADVVAPRFVDGDRVLLTVRRWNNRSDDLVWLDAATGAVLHTNNPLGTDERLTSLSVDPEGKTVAAFWNSVGRIFRVPKGDLAAVIPREDTWFEDATFSPSGDELATVGLDTVVKFRSVREPDDLALRPTRHPLRHPAMTVRVRYSPDGAQSRRRAVGRGHLRVEVPDGPSRRLPHRQAGSDPRGFQPRRPARDA